MDDVNAFDELYHKIQELIKTQNRKITLLEEQIDVQLQIDYFKDSAQLRKNIDKEAVENRANDLFNNNISISDKRELLRSLAKVDSPRAFEAIKKYKENPDDELNQWSILAYQESKMLLESNLLDEAPMFISTGLGGRDSKLRFCLVLLAAGEDFEQWQHQLIEKELDFVLKSYNGELEEISFKANKVIVNFLVPITENVRLVLNQVVNNCNELGQFLSEHYIITNTKKLTEEEVEELIQKRSEDENSESEQE